MRTESKRDKISHAWPAGVCRQVKAAFKKGVIVKIIEKISVIITAFRFWWAYRWFDNAPKDKAEGEFKKD